MAFNSVFKGLNHVNDTVKSYDHAISVIDELMSMEDRLNDSDRVKLKYSEKPPIQVPLCPP